MNTITENELILNNPMPIDRNAAAVYVASLPANTGKRTQAQGLRVVAGIFNTVPSRETSTDCGCFALRVEASVYKGLQNYSLRKPCFVHRTHVHKIGYFCYND